MANSFDGMNAITPPRNAKTITPHNSTDFTFGAAKGIYVGTGGDISVEMIGDGDTSHKTIFYSVPGGQYLLGQFTRVNSTATTATNLVALY
jgi:hypothetical protein